MRALQLIGWALVAVEALVVLWLFVVRDMGDDAAGRGMARGFAMLLGPALAVAAGLLWWGGRDGGWRPAFWVGLLAVSSPVLGSGASFLSDTLRSASHALSLSRQGWFADRRLRAMAASIDRHDCERLREQLAEGPVDATARDPYERTLLGHAVTRVLQDYSGDEGVACVRALLDAGVPVDRRALAPTRTQHSPEDFELIAAVFAGNSPGVVPLLDALLAAGAEPDVLDMHGEPIFFSTYATVPKLEVLARHGADFTRLHTRTDLPGWTAAMNAASWDGWDLASFFLDHGVPVDAVAPDGQSLATILAEHGDDPDPRLAALRSRVGGG